MSKLINYYQLGHNTKPNKHIQKISKRPLLLRQLLSPSLACTYPVPFPPPPTSVGPAPDPPPPLALALALTAFVVPPCKITVLPPTTVVVPALFTPPTFAPTILKIALATTASLRALLINPSALATGTVLVPPSPYITTLPADPEAWLNVNAPRVTAGPPGVNAPSGAPAFVTAAAAEDIILWALDKGIVDVPSGLAITTLPPEA